MIYSQFVPIYQYILTLDHYLYHFGHPRYAAAGEIQYSFRKYVDLFRPIVIKMRMIRNNSRFSSFWTTFGLFAVKPREMREGAWPRLKLIKIYKAIDCSKWPFSRTLLVRLICFGFKSSLFECLTFVSCFSSLPDIPPRSRSKEESEVSDNIYEEIQPPDRDRDHDKRLFYSISKGRRENLEMYKFADWDLEDRLRAPKTDKVYFLSFKFSSYKNEYFQDNYIKPQEIKSSLNKKSSLRKLKTRESRNVTFASDDQSIEEDESGNHRHVQRSKSVHVRSESSKLWYDMNKTP